MPLNVLVTGSRGFIGSNFVASLREAQSISVLEFDRQNDSRELFDFLAVADVVVHLAGVNRPETEAEFYSDNCELTTRICSRLLATGRSVPMIFSSSVQATLDNPYGNSKREAEDVAARYGRTCRSPVTIFRLSNVFGKWCLPNYNSVVATFCYNLSHGLPITISDPNRELLLLHVDDVVGAFESEIKGFASGRGVRNDEVRFSEVTPAFTVTLGMLANLLQSFRDSRRTLCVPDLGDAFVHKLYGTYLSYLEPRDFGYRLTRKVDNRGNLAEFVKSPTFGQVFVSRTRPGVIRGNHYHNTKAEKFLVLEGDALISFRRVNARSSMRLSRPADDPLDSAQLIEYRVSGLDLLVVDIPPGYTHSIENVGKGELVTLFWASEAYDGVRPDTVAALVK